MIFFVFFDFFDFLFQKKNFKVNLPFFVITRNKHFLLFPYCPTTLWFNVQLWRSIIPTSILSLVEGFRFYFFDNFIYSKPKISKDLFFVLWILLFEYFHRILGNDPLIWPSMKTISWKEIDLLHMFHFF